MAEVLVVGATGGREHVAGEAFFEGGHNVSFTHGNAGTGEIGENLGVTDAMDIVDLARQRRFDLAWVGPEAPLINGIADLLHETGTATFGPGADGAQMEGSKEWFAEFAQQFGIPQPGFEIIKTDKVAEAFLQRGDDPNSYVIKADGQAGGKGVILPKTDQEAKDALHGMLSGQLFGEAGWTVVVQDRLNPEGNELSAYYVTDGDQFSLVGVARDNKRIGEGDTGKNTGGMGAYSPVEFLTPELRGELMEIGDRFMYGLKARDIDYRGAIFLGGMQDVEDGDKVKALEANVRFGDPESQVIIPRLGRMGIDFYDLMYDAANGKLDASVVGDLTDRPAPSFISVCLAARNYPEKNIQTDDVIYGLDRRYDGVHVYHGGTKRGEDGLVRTSGGRVLYVTAVGETIDDAAHRAYAVIGDHAIHFAGQQVRGDIAHQARLI